jgi:hypothetical protein
MTNFGIGIKFFAICLAIQAAALPNLHAQKVPVVEKQLANAC